ncbi:MAG TPA: S-layer homology domain-containing protein [Chloroflexia bacterium]
MLESGLTEQAQHPRPASGLQLLRNLCAAAGITFVFATLLFTIWTQGAANAAQFVGGANYLPEGSSFPTPTRTPVPPTPATTPTTAPTACPIQFQDVPADYTFYSVVRCLACRGIVSGYPCGQAADEPCGTSGDPYFRPSAQISRGQIAKIVSQSAGLNDPPGTRIFEDVPEGSPFYDYIQRLTNEGHMSGYPCGLVASEPCEAGNRPYFRPGANATRGQLSKIVANAAGIMNEMTGQTYEDVPPSSPFYQFIERLSALNVMSGYPCASVPEEPCQPGNRPYFRPNAPVTRGQASKIVANTFYPGCETPARK